MLDRFRTLGRLVAALFLAFSLDGCATLNSKNVDGVGYPFAGMGDTFGPGGFSCAATWGAPGWIFFIPFLVIDTPLSLVADIVFLPFDFVYLKSEPKKSRTCA